MTIARTLNTSSKHSHLMRTQSYFYDDDLYSLQKFGRQWPGTGDYGAGTHQPHTSDAPSSAATAAAAAAAALSSSSSAFESGDYGQLSGGGSNSWTSHAFGGSSSGRHVHDHGSGRIISGSEHDDLPGGHLWRSGHQRIRPERALHLRHLSARVEEAST